MRIALVSPYSWTYPGGVTRHIEALATELQALGHRARILAPLDPDDATTRRLHRGAPPHDHPVPEGFVSLGRTVGLPANGAVSNVALTPRAVYTLRKELREGGYDVVHIHEPVVPIVSWDAMCSTHNVALVGTFHTYSENALTNSAASLLGARRRMNHLHARIAVSDAAAWTAKRFFGGNYRIIPNGVHPMGQVALQDIASVSPVDQPEPLRILFIGPSVERKGLPVLLRAFEALREHVPATLTVIGASSREIAPMLLDDRGVEALGKVSEQRKLAELASAQLLCAPSLHGESFGMVLTEAFASSTPVIASDIPGYRDVVRNGIDGSLVAPGDPLALAEAIRSLALDPDRRTQMATSAREHAERFAWSRVAEEVADTYQEAIAVKRPSTPLGKIAVRYGLAPADMLPRVRARRLPSLQYRPAGSRPGATMTLALRLGLMALSFAGLALAAVALQRIGLARILASLVGSSPGLVAVGLGLMCTSMVARGIAWHAILRAAPTWRPARRRDALQGTFIGVLMSSTLPARLGEPSRALIVARRVGRARDTLPVVLGTMVSQTLLNLLALSILGAVMFSSVDLFHGDDRALEAIALAPLGALLLVVLAPVLLPRSAVSRSVRAQALLTRARASLVRVRHGLSVFRNPRQATISTSVQLGAWGLQWMACYFLLMALGLAGRAGIGGAAAVLFAVNVTAVLPATPANIGVFQAACVAVLAGAYHVSTPDALAYGIILQAVEVATAAIMGMPALVKEGLSWREVRLRTMHAAPVKLTPLPGAKRGSARGAPSHLEG
ncbi:MAG TPA: lysylphosphatidylglycerol synthase domain-containing protein [Solirubrobacteraceae bacterium]